MSVAGRGFDWLRTLSLRAKLAVTILAAVTAVLGGSTYLSFRFWHEESLAAAERQALLAAAATRAAVETSLRSGRIEVARRNLRRLVDGGGVTEARVWSSDHVVVFSIDESEEGRTAATAWIPEPDDLDREGVARPADGTGAARAYLPVSIPAAAVLEIVVGDVGVLTAMQRGAYLGVGLTVVSVLVVASLVITMLEREVVGPLHRVEYLLPSQEGAADELGGIERSVVQLVQREREVQELAADQDRQLVAQDGLARVGGLAAEMAHEFKRPLASIRTAVGVLDQECALDEGGRALLDSVHHQLEKLSETMEDLFSLARPMEPGARTLLLADVLDDALLQLAGLGGVQGVTIERDYDADLSLRADGHRLTQAFLNIMTNAVEAMPDGGRLQVYAEARPNSILVRVTDTGIGLSPHEAERVLAPFYSTKPQGTGLGLSVVSRIVEAHQGRLELRGLENGTTVEVELPLDPRSALEFARDVS